MPADNFIPSIYNYCDRWCERCPLTERCEVYASEKAALAANPDIANPDSEDYWAYIAENFAEAMRMLAQAAAEMGIDLDELPETDYDPAEQRRKIDGMDFVRAAGAYHTAARPWLEANRQPTLQAAVRELEMELPGALDAAETTQEAFSIISWYLFQIEVKLRRAQHHLEHLTGIEEEDEFDREQANAQAKIALIGIERSLGAWHLLYQRLPEHQDALISLMAALERTRKLAIRQFPGAPAFRRPGFDD